MELTRSQINQLEQRQLDEPDYLPDKLYDAYLLGQDSFHQKVPYTRCPFTEDDERAEWNRGWTVEQLDVLNR